LLGGFHIDGSLPPLLFAAAAVPVLWFRAVRGWPWTLTIALLVAWLLTPLPRYMLPALAVACVAVAGIAVRIPARGSAVGRLGRCIVVAAAALMVPCGIKAITANSDPYGVAMGKVSERDFRRDHFSPPGYVEALEILGRVVPPGGRAYLLGHVFAGGLPRAAWFDYLYIRPPLYWWVEGAGTPERIAVRARQANLAHIAYNPRGGRGILGERPLLMVWEPADLRAWSGFWQSRVEKTGNAGSLVVYRINRRDGNYPLPRGPLPGTENITAPIDALLEHGRAAEAELAIRRALGRYPSFPPLVERLERVRGGKDGAPGR